MPDYESSRITDSYRFEITASEVRRFAEASWDANPAYRDAAPTGDSAVPPLFGCLAATLSGRRHSLEILGFDVARGFHGEETILLYRPLRVGMVLKIDESTVRLPEVRGRRGGLMRRARRRSRLVDEAGTVIGVTTRTMLETAEPLASSAPTGDTSVFDDGLRVRSDPMQTVPVETEALHEGVAFPSAVFAPITRADFVRYAVASADLTAIHYDENAARSRGYETTFGMGMLSAAYISHAISDWMVLRLPFQLRVRFVDQIWPGDSLTINGEVAEVTREARLVRLSCDSERGHLSTADLTLWNQGAEVPGPDDH